MTRDTDLRDLERRLTRSLHATAPRPAAGMADRLLSLTASTPQRTGFLSLSAGPLLAAAAVVLMAMAVGLGFSALIPRGDNVGGESETPAPTAAPSSTEAPATEAPPSPSPTDGSSPDGQRCENDSIGFSVGYPTDWWANDEVTTDPELDPIPACLYFAEQPVELMQNAALPGGVAIVADIDEQPAGVEEQGVAVVDVRETTVAGRPATVQEVEWTDDNVFQRAGDRAYRYRIALPSGETLLFATVAQQPSQQYEARKAVLDGMMETLELAGS